MDANQPVSVEVTEPLPLEAGGANPVDAAGRKGGTEHSGELPVTVKPLEPGIKPAGEAGELEEGGREDEISSLSGQVSSKPVVIRDGEPLSEPGRDGVPG
jgi:hypothetical protein